MNFPVDFEKMVRLPAKVGNASYPYRISAKDLMMDFRFAALEVDETPTESGISLVETREHSYGGGTRKVKVMHTSQKGLTVNIVFWLEYTMGGEPYGSGHPVGILEFVNGALVGFGEGIELPIGGGEGAGLHYLRFTIDLPV